MSGGSNNYGLLSSDYDAGYDDARAEVLAEVLEHVRGILSTPGMSAGDCYEALATYCTNAGYPVFDYEDPSNPYKDAQQ